MTVLDYIIEQVENGTFECEPHCYYLREEDRPQCTECFQFLSLLVWVKITEEFLEMVHKLPVNKTLRLRSVARHFSKKYGIKISTELFKNQVAKIYNMGAEEMYVENPLNVLR